MFLHYRSDIELQKTCQFKRILFTDIKDLKCSIEITGNVSKDKILQHVTKQFFQSCEKSLNYNSTIIKRLQSPDRNDKKTLSVKEFLESIKRDPDNEYDIVSRINPFSRYGVLNQTNFRTDNICRIVINFQF